MNSATLYCYIFSITLLFCLYYSDQGMLRHGWANFANKCLAFVKSHAASESSFFVRSEYVQWTRCNTLLSQNNRTAYTGRQIVSSCLTSGVSTSADNTRHDFNINMALNSLDFGITSFDTSPSNDQIILCGQESARVRQNIVLDVTKPYTSRQPNRLPLLRKLNG